MMARRREEERAILQAVLEAEKRERIRVSADLHDGVSGYLNSIRNYLSILKIQNKNEDVNEIVQGIKDGVEMALESTRNISHNLMPAIMDTLGGAHAIEDYLDKLNQNGTIEFTFSNSCPDLLILSETGYEIYRIVQETTTNILKYSDATQVNVILCKKEVKENTVLHIIISDNGMLFNIKEAMNAITGKGLKNIQARLKVLQGDLDYEIRENKNYVTYKIPIYHDTSSLGR